MTPTAAVLAPGDYLLELEMLRPVSRSTVTSFLEQAGFCDLVIDPAFASRPAPGSKVRVVAKLTRPTSLAHVPGVLKWRLVHRLQVSPARTAFGPTPAVLDLQEGRAYESRILTRNKSFPTRERIWTALRMLGHEPLKLAEMKRHLRLPNEPGGLWSEWLAWTRWTGKNIVLPQNPSIVFDETRMMS